jgi:hypothetical protein
MSSTRGLRLAAVVLVLLSWGLGVFFGHLAYAAVIDPGVRSVDDPRLYLMLVAAGLGVGFFTLGAAALHFLLTGEFG